MAEAMVASAFTARTSPSGSRSTSPARSSCVERLRAAAGVRGRPGVARCCSWRGRSSRRSGGTPVVNATWDASGAARSSTKHYVNLGIAAATPRGLVVPNVKDADALDAASTSPARCTTWSRPPRPGRTTPADMSGGTITITNVGVFGVDGGTPDHQPRRGRDPVHGRACGSSPGWSAARWRARQVMQLTLSFDHRLIDGAAGSHRPGRRGPPPRGARPLRRLTHNG